METRTKSVRGSINIHESLEVFLMRHRLRENSGNEHD